VNQILKIAMIAVALPLLAVTPAFAQNEWPVLIEFSGAFGIGLVAIGAAYGISRLASSAVESMARQPEVAGNVQVAMIIAAALIEGFTFFAIFVCWQMNPWP
jgi:F-type H+-transporting ATPase subunit c